MLFVFAPGVPAPKGSKSFKGMFRDKQGRMRARLVESAQKKIIPWDMAVVQACLGPDNLPMAVFGRAAVRLTAEFIMPRTGTHRKRGPTKPHITTPDMDKLLRCIKDSLTTAGVWHNDSQACEYGPMVKRYAEPGEPTGARIIVERVQPEEIEHVEVIKKPAGKARPGRTGRKPAGAAGGGECPYFV